MTKVIFNYATINAGGKVVTKKIDVDFDENIYYGDRKSFCMDDGIGFKDGKVCIVTNDGEVLIVSEANVTLSTNGLF